MKNFSATVLLAKQRISLQKLSVTFEICHVCLFLPAEVNLATRNMDVGHMKRDLCLPALPLKTACQEIQLLTAARTDLLWVQTLMSIQFNEGVERLRAAQVPFLMERPTEQGTSEISSGSLDTDPPRKGGTQ